MAPLRAMVLWALILGLVAVLIVGCETAKGIGRDLQSIGNAIENSARKAQD